MGKRLTIALAIIALTLGTATVSVADTGTATTGQTQTAQGHMQRLKAALAQLDLSAGQKGRIRHILADAKAKLEALKSGAAGGSVDKAQARPIIKAAVEKIFGVLSPGQQAKLKEILKADRAGSTAKP